MFITGMFYLKGTSFVLLVTWESKSSASLKLHTLLSFYIRFVCTLEKNIPVKRLLFSLMLYNYSLKLEVVWSGKYRLILTLFSRL